MRRGELNKIGLSKLSREDLELAYEKVCHDWSDSRDEVRQLMSDFLNVKDALKWYATPGIHERWKAEAALAALEKIVGEK